MPWEGHVVFSRYFSGEQGREYWRTLGGFALAAVAVCAATWAAVRAIPLGGTVGLVVDGVVAAAVAGGLLLCVFRRDALALVRLLLKR